MRLARYVVGTLDVDGMLHQITPEQFDEWCAYDQIEPISHDTAMLSRICFNIEAWMYAQARNGKTPDIEEFMPWLRGLPRDAQNSQAKHVMQSMFGGQVDGKSW